MPTPAVLLLVLAAGGSSARREHSAVLVLEVADKLGGCAVGDLDPAHPGNEIVVTSSKGAVFVVRREGDAWTHEVAYQSPGEMIQVAAGDADPARPGDEIVVVGMAAGPEDDGGPGAAHLVWRAGSDWKSARLLETDGLAHGVAIGGGRVFVTGYDRKVHLLRVTGGACERIASADLPGNGKAALAVANGVVVGCTDGSLIEARVDGERLVTRVLDKRDCARSRLATDGTRILTSDDDGTLTLVGPAGRQAIHHEDLKLRGAVLADLDPDRPGLEAATTGYAGRVTILYETDGRFEPSLLFADRAGFHHATAGELDGGPGLELVTCGLAGRVLVFRFGARTTR